jgi:hypothetical protein
MLSKAVTGKKFGGGRTPEPPQLRPCCLEYNSKLLFRENLLIKLYKYNIRK